MTMAIAAPKCFSFFSINTTCKSPPPRPPIPIFISTDPSAVDLRHLSCLYSCNHSLHRFLGPSEPKPAACKLGVIIVHSSVVVSGFSKAEDAVIWALLSPENGRLVGFWRAVSDLGFTASLYDIVVLPGLRRMGIGRLIVQRIVIMLTTRGVYDISALCSEQESLFFKACGFGDDMLGATTMMYAATTSSHSESSLVVKAGSRILLAPPQRVPFKSVNS